MGLWINGQLVGARESKHRTTPVRDKFSMGTEGRPDLPRFKGLLDNVRVYNRALTEREIISHVKDESADHGVSFFSSSVPFSTSATRFFKSHPNAIDLEQQDNSILFSNRQLGIEIGIGGHGFVVNRLYAIADEQDFLIGNEPGGREMFEIRMTPDLRGSGRDHRGDSNKGSLMGIVDEMAAEAFSVGSQSAKSISWKRHDADGQTTLHLNWQQIPVRGDVQFIDIEVTITLRDGLMLIFKA